MSDPYEDLRRDNERGRTHKDGNGKDNEATGYRFRLVPFGEIKLSRDPAYLVKGIIPREGIVVIWGPPKCGKSFWTYDLTMHIALAWPYRGRRVAQGPVVYVACEGERGLGARTEAFRQDRLAQNAADVPFYLIATRLDLGGEHKQLIADIRAQIGSTKPVALTIDTLNRSIAGSESDDRDMGDYVKAADAVREAFGCAVLLIHHCGVNGTRPRGHTSLTGAADAQLAVKRGTDGLITVTLEWLKDGAEGDEINSRLQVVEVGTDEDGEQITSCVVVACDAEPKPRGAPATYAPATRVALAALREAINEGGQPAPGDNHIPSAARVVDVELWRKFAYDRNISDRGPSAQQKAFKRAMLVLQSSNAIGCWQGSVWII
jgi:hypothetical protein